MLIRREPDAGRALCRALRRSAADHGCAIGVDHDRETPWASATFVGANHKLTMTAPAGLPLDAWLAILEAAELTMPGQIVADIVVVSRDDRDGTATIRIEAHTIVS